MVKRIVFKSIHFLYYLIIPLLVLGISFGYTSPLLALLALIILMFTINRHAVGVFLIMYGGSIAGIIRTIYPFIPLYGIVFVVLGFLLVWDLLLVFFKTQLSSIVWLGLLLLIFFLFFLIGPLDEFAGNKYLKMCLHGIITLIGYYVLNKSNKIDGEDMIRLLLVGSICMYAFVILFYDFTPGGLFDYNWFREQVMDWDYKYEETSLNYQHISLSVLYGIAIYLSQIRLKPLKTTLYLLCSTQLILVSGCRQAILGLLVVVFLRFVIFSYSSVVRKYKSTENVGYRLFGRLLSFNLRLFLAVFVLVFLVSMLSSGLDAINRTMAEGDLDRMRLFNDAWDLFYSHPMFGVGIGGFNYITGVAWPHNLFAELLCETGLIGFLLVFIFVIINLIHKRIGLFYVTQANLFYFIIVAALFVRLMVSSDLSESIELFCAVFAIPSVIKNTKSEEHPNGNAIISVTYQRK